VTDRADKIIDAAERVLREQRGRSAPVTNQATPDWGPLYRYLQGVVMGCVAGLMLGYVLGVAFPPRQDTCQIRASSAHVSMCLDKPIAKARELGMPR
jgi:hypothetical protein